MGTQIPTGPGPARIAASPSGRRMASANLGPGHSSITIMEQDRKGAWSLRSYPGALSGGMAFAGEKSVWVSEGSTGVVRLLDTETGDTRRLLDLNRDEMHGSFSGDLAFDGARDLLFVLDPAHDRVVTFDAHTHRLIGQAATGSNPRSISRAPNGERLYVSSSDQVSVIDVTGTGSPKSVATIPAADAGGILGTSGAVFVSHPHEDSIEVIDPALNSEQATISLRIPGLESLRGVQPVGMAYDESRHWLLVAEAGLNAVGVIDPAQGRVLGHVPVGWFPTSLISANGTVMVVNSKSASASRFELPGAEELGKTSRLVLALNGLLQTPDRTYPSVNVRHVVIIVKGSRTFDDILGDMTIPGSMVAGLPQFASFGNEGYADGGRKRFSLQEIPVTPNHHAIALRFTSSDNFYADPDENADGLSEHLQRNHISFLDFGEAFDTNISDQSRASRFFSELDKKYKKEVPLPQVILLHLPNDETAAPQPRDGYPYAASYAADNDLALGRVIEYLSHSEWWREMAVFVTEADTHGGRDHIDPHRTVFLGVGPWFRRGYVSHVNASYPALLKAVFHLLGIPPWRLTDAAAADLGDMFTYEPDYTAYVARPTDPRLFDASAVHQQ